MKMKILKDCTEDKITQAAKALIDGHLVVFPTETVYGLDADATNVDAVSRMYDLKARPKDHPVIIHISSIKRLNNWVTNFPPVALKLSRVFWPGPLTMILNRSNLAKDFITGGQESIGLRIPSNKIALSLLDKFEKLGGQGVAAPSANKFGAVSPTNLNDVVEEFAMDITKNDLILDGGPSRIGLESTIIDLTSAVPIILRPGAITQSMISKVIGLNIEEYSKLSVVKSPGSLKNHYSPKTKVVLDVEPMPGDGLIALKSVKTPINVIRLAMPKNLDEFAHQLYGAFRRGDKSGVKRIIVIQPEDDKIGNAIRDRLRKASS